MNDAAFFEVKNLKKYYPIKSGFFNKVSGFVKAVDGISFTIEKGKTMGLVGESGCGKTTVGKTILRLNSKTAGDVLYKGRELFELDAKEMRKLRPKMQLFFKIHIQAFLHASLSEKLSEKQSESTKSFRKMNLTIILQG